MASALICLAKNKEKFNFAKLIFDHVVKALDNSSNQHYLYPRFLQLLMDKQFTNKKVHDKVYPVHSHIKKVFSNMKRKVKDFPVIVKPLFQAMLELGQHKKGERSRTYNESSSNGTDSGEGNRRCQETKGDNASDEDKSGEEEMELVKKLMVKYTKLKEEVLGLQKITDTQGDLITGLKLRVKQLGGQKGSRTRSFKRLKKWAQDKGLVHLKAYVWGRMIPNRGGMKPRIQGKLWKIFIVLLLVMTLVWIWMWILVRMMMSIWLLIIKVMRSLWKQQSKAWEILLLVQVQKWPRWILLLRKMFLLLVMMMKLWPKQ
jgi:hypothetical protein